MEKFNCIGLNFFYYLILDFNVCKYFIFNTLVCKIFSRKSKSIKGTSDRDGDNCKKRITANTTDRLFSQKFWPANILVTMVVLLLEEWCSLWQQQNVPASGALIFLMENETIVNEKIDADAV